ncbi:CIC11C00000004415 [Sungouiella intermedia]|uniref:CIC11C00000004415 n=1 Tax=Sungouiella intermedia TaxID=45354 RepID=A0A1L0D2F6_9ASCO|nr:CIC11C00000004415 [[Candida] intermedia]
MKIIDKEEREAHASYVLSEGLKGMFYGSVVSLGLFSYLRLRHPARFRSFNTSIKACILTMPTISLAAFFADEGSVEFDRRMYSSGYTNKKVLEEYRDWNNLPVSDKVFTTLSNNQYKVIFTSWVASMYGSWVYVNRDKVMTTPQKLVQARMYAQAITIVLLLSTVLLAMKKEEINKKRPAPIPEWKRVLQEKEAELAERAAEE